MIELKGNLKVASSMDQNTFILTNSHDQFVAELVVTEASMYNKIFKAFKDFEKTQETKFKEESYIDPSLRLPIQLIIKVR